MVHEKKAVYFLSSEVIGRPLRGKSKRNRQETLACESIRTKYLAALTYLYEAQKSADQNHHSHPNGAALKTLMESLRRKQSQAKRDSFEDRGAGTLLDSYTEETMRKVVSMMWTQTSVPEQYLRTTATFLMSHMLVLRGEAMRIAELPDLFVVDFNNEGT